MLKGTYYVNYVHFNVHNNLSLLREMFIIIWNYCRDCSCSRQSIVENVACCCAIRQVNRTLITLFWLIVAYNPVEQSARLVQFLEHYFEATLGFIDLVCITLGFIIPYSHIFEMLDMSHAFETSANHILLFNK